jgi:hypothetical protein
MQDLEDYDNVKTCLHSPKGFPERLAQIAFGIGDVDAGHRQDVEELIRRWARNKRPVLSLNCGPWSAFGILCIWPYLTDTGNHYNSAEGRDRHSSYRSFRNWPLHPYCHCGKFDGHCEKIIREQLFL